MQFLIKHIQPVTMLVTSVLADIGIENPGNAEIVSHGAILPLQRSTEQVLPDVEWHAINFTAKLNFRLLPETKAWMPRRGPCYRTIRTANQ